IVDPSQLVAAIAHGFRAMREELEQSHDLQVDRHARLEELLQQGAAPSAATTQVLTGVEVGQGRILSSIERVHRALMRTFDLHLWNRIETSAPAAEVIELYRSWHREHAEAVAFAPGFYREVAQRRQNSALGAMPTTLDPILGMVLLADGLATATAPQATRALAEAQVAKDAHDLAATLGRAVKLQDQIQTVLQQLLARLDEWNDFQDLIQETRALRDRQKDVQIRTEEIRGKK
ncbi:MAG TPA: hypothetical protein VK348_05375, partial [Planctomycetota bacterium]|nr:hypothetical protein [Planctomycetota bacterium]